MIILHFRRGDYVNMILQNRPKARTIVSFDYIIDSALKQLKTLNEKNVDCLTTSPISCGLSLLLPSLN